jgi:hypothetical protein
VNAGLKLIQHIVVKTNSVPLLKDAYGIYYSLTVKCCAYFLSTVPGVSAVYLTGGLATGAVTYGLSDVDLIIFVNKNRASVLKRYENLSRIFPLLAAGEPAVYEADDVKHYLNNSSELKNLFLSYRLLPANGFSRLLYGESISLPSLAPDEAKLKFAAIGQSWSILINKLIISKTTGISLSYICSKLKRTFSENSDVVRKDSTPSGMEASETFSYCAEKIKEKARTLSWSEALEQISDGLNFEFSRKVMVSRENSLRIAEFVSAVKKDFPKIKSVLLSPVSYVALEEDRLGVFIVEREPLTLQEVKDLKNKLGHQILRQSLELYLLTEDVALSVQWAGSEWWHPSPVLWPFSDPLTFLHLQLDQSVCFGEPLKYPDAKVSYLKSVFASYGKTLVRSEKAKKLKHVNDRNLIRLPTNDFQHLFWQALQIKAAELEGTVFCCSHRIAEHWKSKTAAAWIPELQSEYVKDLSHTPTASEKLYPVAF